MSTKFDLNILDLRKDLETLKNQAGEVNHNSKKFNDETRKSIAETFVHWYFKLLILAFIIPPIFNLSIYLITNSSDLFIPLKDTVLLITSAIGGPLGFIVGFYFKDSK